MKNRRAWIHVLAATSTVLVFVATVVMFVLGIWFNEDRFVGIGEVGILVTFAGIWTVTAW